MLLLLLLLWQNTGLLPLHLAICLPAIALSFVAAVCLGLNAREMAQQHSELHKHCRELPVRLRRSGGASRLPPPLLSAPCSPCRAAAPAAASQGPPKAWLTSHLFATLLLHLLFLSSLAWSRTCGGVRHHPLLLSPPPHPATPHPRQRMFRPACAGSTAAQGPLARAPEGCRGGGAWQLQLSSCLRVRREPQRGCTQVGSGGCTPWQARPRTGTWRQNKLHSTALGHLDARFQGAVPLHLQHSRDEGAEHGRTLLDGRPRRLIGRLRAAAAGD